MEALLAAIPPGDSPSNGQDNSGSLQTSNTIKKVSCTFCKRRKIKCDRQSPCSSCIKYKSSCEYLEHTKRRNKRSVILNELDELRKKVSKLENNLEGDKPLDVSPYTGSNPNLGSGMSLTGSGLSINNLMNSGPPFKLPDLDPRPGSLGTDWSKSGSNSGSNNENSAANTFSNSDTSPSSLGFNAGSSNYESDGACMRGRSAYCFKDVELNYLANDSFDEEFDIYKGVSTLTNETSNYRTTFSPLSWRGMCTFDPALKINWDYFVSMAHEILDDDKEAAESMDQDIKKFGKFRNQELCLADSLKDNVKLLGLYSDRFFQSTEDYHTSQLALQIENALPVNKVVWKLIDRFFSTTGLVSPFYERSWVEANVERILGRSQKHEKSVVKVTKRLDFAHLGIILIILRFSYISLFSVDTKKNEEMFRSLDPDPEVQELKYILNNPIKLECFELAQVCFNSFDLLNPSHFEVFQLALSIYLYRSYGPEFGKEPNSLELNNLRSLVIHIGFSLGFNIVADENSSDVARYGQSGWQFLVFDDIRNCFTCGYPMLHLRYPYDLKKLKLADQLPSLSSTYIPGADPSEIYYKQISSLSGKVVIVIGDLLTNFLKRLNDPAEKVVIREIFIMHEKLTGEFEDPSGSFQTFFNTLQLLWGNQPIVGVFNLKFQLEFKYGFTPYFFKLFNIFESNGQWKLATYCLKKLLTNQVALNKDMVEIITTDQTLSFMAIPGFLFAVHKDLLVLLALYLRVKLNNINNDLANKLLANLKGCLESYIDIADKLSHRFFYAWYIKKSIFCWYASCDTVIKGQTPPGSTDFKFPLFGDPEVLTDLNLVFNSINHGGPAPASLTTEKISGIYYDDESKNVDDIWKYLGTLNGSEDLLSFDLFDEILKEKIPYEPEV